MLCIAVTALSFVLIYHTLGESIFIENAGFESDSPQIPDNTYWYYNHVVTGFSRYDPNGIMKTWSEGIHNPTGGTTFNDDTFGESCPEARACLWMQVDIYSSVNQQGKGEFGIEQTLTGNVLMPHTTYTISAYIGNPQNSCWDDSTDGSGCNDDKTDYTGFPGYKFQLLAGNDIIAEDPNSLIIGDGKWELSTVQVTIAEAHSNIGDTLKIRLINTNTARDMGLMIYFDDIRLKAVTTASSITTTQITPITTKAPITTSSITTTTTSTTTETPITTAPITTSSITTTTTSTTTETPITTAPITTTTTTTTTDVTTTDISTTFSASITSNADTTATSTSSESSPMQSTESISRTSTSANAKGGEGKAKDNTESPSSDSDENINYRGNESEMSGSNGGDTLYILIGSIVGVTTVIVCVVIYALIRVRMNKTIAKDLANVKKSIDENTEPLHTDNVTQFTQTPQQRTNGAITLEIAGSNPQKFGEVGFHNPALFGSELRNVNAVNNTLMDDIIEDMDKCDHTTNGFEGDHVTKGGFDEDTDMNEKGEGGYENNGDEIDNDEDIIAGIHITIDKEDMIVRATTAGGPMVMNGIGEEDDNVEAPPPPMPPVDDEYEYYEDEQVINAETIGRYQENDDEYEYYEEDIPAPPAPPV